MNYASVSNEMMQDFINNNLNVEECWCDTSLTKDYYFYYKGNDMSLKAKYFNGKEMPNIISLYIRNYSGFDFYLMIQATNNGDSDYDNLYNLMKKLETEKMEL